MAEATAQTVLADFDSATFTYAGITSTFYQRDGEYWVQTDGPDGTLADYRVRYTFGVTPLQQYLLEYPGGRLQALAISWDTRPADAGGQRWFHSYLDSAITHSDPRHWTGRLLNWNWGCASCHSTNLVKGYDAASDTYHTTWSDVDVGCEACHGPASAHLAWAEDDGRPTSETGGTGLITLLDDSGSWVFDSGSAIAGPPASRPNRLEVETCAPCHSRRATLAEGFLPGDPLLDAFLPRALSEDLYFADGQIEEEVYVYGSFVQSRMYHVGVTCSDCHDAHSLTLKAPGNAVCAQCHRPAVYDDRTHHFHPEGSAGASCAKCHMPTRPYMVIDYRLDHSMRIPRPDLSRSLGTPDACSGCHEDRDAAWAERYVAEWYGEPDTGRAGHYGEAISATRGGTAGGVQAAIELARSGTAPAIVRATALELLSEYPIRASIEVAIDGIDDPDPLVRVHALRVLELLPPADGYQFAEHRLRDSILAVRAEAGRILAATPTDPLTTAQRVILDSAVADYLAIQALEADQPSSWINIGLLEQARGRFLEAETAYRTAIRLDPAWTPAYANLADAYRQQQRDEEGEKVLRQGLASVAEPAGLHHALGLLLIRAQRMDEAMVELERAAALAPEQPRLVYVYGVALDNTGETERAIAVMRSGLEDHPNNREMTFALAAIYRDLGDVRNALRYARRLAELEPESDRSRALVAQLEAMASP